MVEVGLSIKRDFGDKLPKHEDHDDHGHDMHDHDMHDHDMHDHAVPSGDERPAVHYDKVTVELAPDLIEVFRNSGAVNDALRELLRRRGRR